MKPSWSDAPEWANWCAQDSRGTWIFFEFKPHFSEHGFYWVSEGMEYSYPNEWKETLERRPE